jgi:hypothetical protein
MVGTKETFLKHDNDSFHHLNLPAYCHIPTQPSLASSAGPQCLLFVKILK